MRTQESAEKSSDPRRVRPSDETAASVCRSVSIAGEDMSVAFAPKAKLLPKVCAELNYLAPTRHRLRNYAYEPPEGIPRTTIVDEARTVGIRSARPIQADLALDAEGFTLVQHRSKVTDYNDDDKVKRVYYPESADILEKMTGADRIVIFDHTVRRHIPGFDSQRSEFPRQPVKRVHVDQTTRSGPKRVRDLLPGEADVLLRGRVQIVNLWRPIRGPVRDLPLAVCDASSVAVDQLVPSELVYLNRIGETYAVKFDPGHRWFYVPEMQTHEVLLLKSYDSQTKGCARFTPHSAFSDPTAPPDAAPRESIELRALVFHTP